MAHQLARRGHDVLLWAREPEVSDGITARQRNPLFLSDMDLYPTLAASSDLERVAAWSPVWVWVVPVQFSRAVMNTLDGAMRPDVVMVSSSKGIETTTLQTMDQIAWEALALPSTRFCCLSGPTFAREVVRGDPSLAVLACPDVELAARLQEEFSDHHLRLYAGRDLIGVEIAGALKNPIAIAAGVLDCGDHPQHGRRRPQRPTRAPQPRPRGRSPRPSEGLLAWVTWC